MASRTLPANATPSVWGQPVAGEKNKNFNVTGPYNAQQSSTATSDVVVVYADYGVFDTTTTQNLDANSTNFKDNA